MVWFVVTVGLLVAEAWLLLSINSFFFNFCLLIISIVSGVRFMTRNPPSGWITISLSAIFVVLLPLLLFTRWHSRWGSDWKTQTVIYQHRYWPNRTIVFQMMNPGPGSYKHRTIEKIELLPGLDWLNKVELSDPAFLILKDKVDTLEWKRVDIEKNELGLKYP